MLLHKSTRDSRIVALVLMYTDGFLTDTLDLPPSSKWETNTGVVNSISVHLDMFCRGLL